MNNKKRSLNRKKSQFNQNDIKKKNENDVLNPEEDNYFEKTELINKIFQLETDIYYETQLCNNYIYEKKNMKNIMI